MHRKTATTNELYYLHLDLQGSLYRSRVGFLTSKLFPRRYNRQCDTFPEGNLSTFCIISISNTAGHLVEERNYDAWGRPRIAQNQECQFYPSLIDFRKKIYFTKGNTEATCLPCIGKQCSFGMSNPFGGSSSTYTLRGYTFHEHLDMFDLINMNGRIYDTHFGQFVNADPILLDDENSQNINRYSYVLNNPLYCMLIGFPKETYFTYSYTVVEYVTIYGNLSANGIKYTDPSGYAYGGFSSSNTSGAVIGTTSFISDEVLHFNAVINEFHDASQGDFFLATGGGGESDGDPTPKKSGTNAPNWSPKPPPQKSPSDYWKSDVPLNSVTKEIQSGDGVPKWVNSTLSSAGAVVGSFELMYKNDTTQVLKYAEKVNGKLRTAITLTRVNRINSFSNAKTCSRLGAGLTVLSVVTIGYDAIEKRQWQNHHTADLVITGAFYVTAGSFPVVGWIIGGAYFVGDLTTQYYTGKSITQNLFE